MSLRRADAVRVGLGALALGRPRWLLRCTGATDGTWPRRAVRVLGARYVAQAAAGAVLPGRWSSRLDAGVDLAHAATTVGLAVAFPSHRRAAVVSGAVALVFAAADLGRL